MIHLTGRGSLVELAEWSGSREALLEVTVVNGTRYTIRHVVDGIARDGSSVVIGSHRADLRPFRGRLRRPPGRCERPGARLGAAKLCRGGASASRRPATGRGVRCRGAGLDRFAERARQQERRPGVIGERSPARRVIHGKLEDHRLHLNLDRN